MRVPKHKAPGVYLPKVQEIFPPEQTVRPTLCDDIRLDEK